MADATNDIDPANPNIQVPLSASLAEALSYDGLVSAPIDTELGNAIVTKVLGQLSTLANAYHNRAHTESVLARVDRFGEAASLSEHELQLLRVAAVFHDFGHSGTSYRQLSSATRNDISNEEYAALIADENLAPYLSARDRLVVQGLILGTSFGQNSRELLPTRSGVDLFRSYKPHTKLEKLLSTADISEFLDGFEAFMTSEIELIEEASIEMLPKNFLETVQAQINFLQLVESRLKDVASYLDRAFLGELNSAFTSVKSELFSLQSGTHPRTEAWRERFEKSISARLEELKTKKPS